MSIKHVWISLFCNNKQQPLITEKAESG